MKKRKQRFGTLAVHAGEDGFPYRPSSTPIYQTSTFTFDAVDDAAETMQGSRSGFVYTRIGNPTVQAFEQKLAALEGAEAAVAFASGMAAISAVFLELVRPGDEVISCSQIYGGTRGFYEQVLKLQPDNPPAADGFRVARRKTRLIERATTRLRRLSC